MLRLKTDLNARIALKLRQRLNKALKGNFKIGSAVRDLGCSIKELKERLESKFYSHPETNEEMSWDNYGRKGWHIDHIKLLASFNLSDRKQFLIANHYNNLQPLWAEDNLRKNQ